MRLSSAIPKYRQILLVASLLSLIISGNASAASECWAGFVGVGNEIHDLDAYPDRASILEAARQRVEVQVLGATRQCGS